jgi:hypothetical protein
MMIHLFSDDGNFCHEAERGGKILELEGLRQSVVFLFPFHNMIGWVQDFNFYFQCLQSNNPLDTCSSDVNIDDSFARGRHHLCRQAGVVAFVGKLFRDGVIWKKFFHFLFLPGRHNKLEDIK